MSAQANGTREKIPLFRPEAVEHARNQWLGEFALSVPLPAALVSLFLVGVVAIVIVLLFTLQYTRRVTITGEIRSDPGVARIAAAQDGEVRAVFVHEGDRVHAGRPLFSLADPHVLNSLSDATSAQLGELAGEAAAVRSSIGENAAATFEQMQTLQAKRAIIQSEIATVRSQIAQQGRRIAYSMAILNKYESLLRHGYTSDMAVLGRRDDVESKQQTMAALENSLLDLQASLKETDGRIAAEEAANADRELTSSRDLGAIERQQLELQVGDQSLQRAPVAGTVTGIQLAVGQHIAAGSPALAIVPSEGRLVAVLEAGGEAAGLAKVGESILLRLDAFPYERFGLQRGIVQSVTRTAIDTPAASPGAADRSFLLYVRIPRAYVTSGPDRYELKPGMRVSGELLLDRKPIIAWLLGPLGQFLASTRQ